MLREDRRLALKIAVAVRSLSAVTAALAPQEGQLSPIGLPYEEPQNRITQVSVADRRQADFTDSEIDEYLRQSGFQSIMTTNAEWWTLREHCRQFGSRAVRISSGPR